MILQSERVIDMYLFNKSERNMQKVCDDVRVPYIAEFENEKATNSIKVKTHTGTVLRFATCMSLVLVLIAVIVFQNSGGFATKTTPVQNGTSAGNTGAKDSFTLTAYAATPNVSSSGTTSDDVTDFAAMTSDTSTGTAMQPNVKITLPTGIYESGVYTFAVTSRFEFTGENIKSITMSTQKGNVFAMDFTKAKPYLNKKPLTDSDNNFLLSLFVAPAPSISFPYGYSAGWIYKNDESHGDISDIITITVSFQDGSAQTKTVTIGEGENNSITCVLNG